MRIDLTSPVELWHCRIPTPDDPVLTMQIYNMSDKDVRSIQVCVHCYDAEGDQYARHVERLQGIDGPGRHVFEASLEVEEAEYAQDLEVIIEKVWFDDNTIWRKGLAEPLEFKPSPLLSGPQLQVMQELAGPDAASYPSDQGAVWVCVCGRPNSAHEDTCRRCRRDKHAIFTKLNEAAIERVLFTRQSAIEDEQRRQREEARRQAAVKEARQRRQRRRRRIILTALISILLVIGLFYGVYFHGIPYYRYYQANRTLENGQFDSAKAQFLALADYRDSADLAQECDYRAAMNALNGGTFTSLRAAQSGFDALGDYKDSATRAQEARYVYAEKLLASGNWADAIALYESVPNYSNARMRRSQAEYEWALDLMGKKQYGEARDKFMSLGSFQNSESNAKECLYQPALEALDYGGDPLTAIETFKELGDYRDSAFQLQRAHYAAGDAAFRDSDYEAAAEYFLAAGDYSDAYRRAAACLYTPAVTAMNEGDYQRAAEMLEKISGYQDSRALLMQCYYYMGAALMADGEYARAVEYFDKAPDLLAAQEAKKECVYRPALMMLEEGDQEGALALLQTISDYGNATAYINQILYDRAMTQMEQEDYESAAALLRQVGEYQDAVSQLARALTNAAQARIENGQYEQAITLVSDDSDNEAVQEALRRARYLLAAELKDQGDYETARGLYEALGDYEDAVYQYRQCVYLLALEKVDEGDMAAAMEMLAAIEQEDSTARAALQELAYRAGEEAVAADDKAAAAAMFERAGDYRDAQARAQEYADAYCAAAYETAQAAVAQKDYRTVIEALSPLQEGFLPEKYADIPSMYKEACYLYANELYNDRRPFEALKYYQLIPDYRDVASYRLERAVYKLMGQWETEKGQTFEFREDGSCNLLGEEAYYYVPNMYAVNTGAEPNPTTLTYEIVSQRQNALTLRNTKTRTTYRLKRVEEEAI